MKKNKNLNILLKCLFLSSTLLLSFGGASYVNNTPSPYEAISLEPKEISVPTTLYLKHNDEAEVRAYYDDLNNLAPNELKGYNLLKNLKPILKRNTTYVNYNTVWQTSCITERDWTRSSIETIPCDSLDLKTMTVKGYKDSYNYKDKGGDDPYLWVLYRNDNGSHNITINAMHNPDPGVGGLNKEHVWCQSRGFKGSPVTGPAGTDVHHLIVADALVNQASHNNISYGDVTTYSKNNPTAKFPVMGKYEGTEETYIVGNYRGTSKGVSGEVFEPLDEHKGDIARAIFYMAARYNNLADESGAISNFEPNLTINNDMMPKSSEYSSDSKAVNMSYLKYLYQWHKQDPVDDFEIYRNDLIYNNVQGNRNPFIDYPEWVDLIWNENGENASSISYASPSSDEVRIYNKTPGQGGEVIPPSDVKVSGLELNVTSKELRVGENFKVIASISPSDATNKGLEYTSSNPSVASVDNTGNITALKVGTTNISVKTLDGSNITKTCKITVIGGEEVIPPTDDSFKTTINGSSSVASKIIDLNTGKYFIATPDNHYLSSDNLALASGKISAKTGFNHNLTTGYFDIIKQNDNKTYNIINPNTGDYIGYDSGTNLLLEASNAKSSKSNWTITSDETNLDELFFSNVSNTGRALLYQISSTRFGGYSTSNITSSSYTGVKLYQCIYTYDVLINKLKTMDCTTMQDQTFINDLTSLYNKLTSKEQSALVSENIICNDGKTYTAYQAYQYALNFINNINMNKANISLNSNYIILIAFIILVSFISINIFYVNKKRKARK